MTAEQYPKPQAHGGVLIRRVIKSLDAYGCARPLLGPVRVAVSGGADSVALALLLAKYGRRVVAARDLELIHFNHHWRGRESGADQAFVRRLATRLAVRLKIYDLSPDCPKGRSLEEWGRAERLKVFNRFKKGVILLAHHQDDQAETVLWRILSGAPRPLWAGIPGKNGRVIRPFLGVSKQELVAFLKEEGVRYRTDSTNLDKRFLRAQLRTSVTPAVDKVFPAWRRALSQIGTG